MNPPRSDVRRTLKYIMVALATVAVSPILLHCRLWFLVGPTRRDQIFLGHIAVAVLIPGVVGNYLRLAFYRQSLSACATDVCISFGTTFATHEVTIGSGTYIGPHCNLGHADIGEDVLIGTGVMITSGRRQHYFKRLDIPIRMQGGQNSRVAIGTDSWIGNGSIVMASVGAHSVVGAGAVVSDAVPELSIVSGNPATVVATRTHRAPSS